MELQFKCMEVQAVPILLSHHESCLAQFDRKSFRVRYAQIACNIAWHFTLARSIFVRSHLLWAISNGGPFRIFGLLCNYQTVHNWLENALCFLTNYGFDQVIDDQHQSPLSLSISTMKLVTIWPFWTKKKTRTSGVRRKRYELSRLNCLFRMSTWLHVPAKSDLEHKCAPPFRCDWITFVAIDGITFWTVCTFDSVW